QRPDPEQNRPRADRHRHLHQLPANLLAPHNLQHYLLSHAEVEIVRLANEVLDGLSGGKMRLELRNATDAGTALDLLVYNLETGQKPIAVALASGSQRFRIAVSLALAIGSYAGSEARQMEAVIIDEGFGSLDKVGRNDMIQELNDLKEQLKRIILVSHQEEFTDAFVNGYRIELVDGASRVSMLDQV
ncbi:MAG: hypothetical protein JRN24_02475, partial [Nitrososphaerota archaeon]|nr:hypothetical protein [Nitrososphaerota archaeon]